MSTCYDCGQNDCRCKGSTSLPDVLAAVTLGPEDRVILCYPVMNHDKYALVRREIERAGFGDRALVASGIEDVIVLRATKAEGSAVGQCGDFMPLITGLSNGVRACHLAYGHTGMHSDGQATWSNDPPIRLQPESVPHGYTSHGHPCCGDAVVGGRPRAVARCGGAGICKVCAGDAARIHEGGQR